MKIRKADIQDSMAICKICCDDLEYECRNELIAYRLSNIDYEKAVVFVAEIDNTIVGYIHAEIYKLLYHETMVNVLGLAVASDCRRRGFGKALLNSVEQWARDLNINTIRLNSGAERKEAHEFYNTMGYKNTKEQIRFTKIIK